MMRKLRDNTAVVLWVLILAFVGTIVFSWGMGGFDTISGGGKTVVASINGEEVEYQDYERLVSNRLQQSGNQTDSRAVTQARSQSWNDLIHLSLERRLARAMGLRASDREITDRILYLPSWVAQDSTFQTNGQFDTLKWHEILRGENMRSWLLGMEDQLRQSMPLEKFRARLMSTALASDANLLEDHLQRSQTALGSFLVFIYAAFPVDSSEISEAELLAWFKENQKKFELEERREIEYVQFPVVPSREDSLDARDQIEFVRKQLDNGESFEDLARIYSMDESNADKGGDLGWFGRGRMVPEFDAASFGEPVGSVVGPVATRFGLHLLKINGRELRDNGTGVKEEQASVQHILIKIEPSSMTHSDLRARADALYEDVQNGHDFEVLCAERQLKIQPGRPFTIDGTVPGVGRSQRAAALVFQAKQGEVLAPAYSEQGGWYVMRVKQILPKGTDSFKERRAEAESAVRREKQKALALQAARDYLASARPTALDSTMALPPRAEFGQLDQPVRINQFIRGNVGRDLAFSATLFTMPVGAVSEPVAGERGVYLIHCLQRDDEQEVLQAYAAELPTRRVETIRQQKGGIYGNWSSWMRERAAIKDHRVRFGIDY
ncbi:MAG: peptidylprolyl isomerase [bacterium]|jgi:parvulin-like peptidyl-prolyl isomerase|nr:peptidylprolyl isomerase [bacterium]